MSQFLRSSVRGLLVVDNSDRHVSGSVVNHRRMYIEWFSRYLVE